jgi:hypothetical protein
MNRAVAVLGMLLATSVASAETPATLPTVKLLDAGHGPKQVMRLSSPVGTKQKVVMTMVMDMAMGMNAASSIKTLVPTMQLDMSVEVLDTSKDGDLHCRMSIDDARVIDDGRNPSAVEAVRRSVATMKGMTGETTISSRNFTLSAHFDVPNTVDPAIRTSLEQFQQSMSNVSAPFPEEPVGTGARWSVVTALPVNGVSLRQRVEYTLKRRHGDDVEIAATIHQDAAAHQQMTNPSLPPGTKLTVVSWRGSGAGKIRSDLAKKLVPAGSFSLSTGGKMTVELGSQRQAMSMLMHMTMSIE